jgi:protein TonB
MPVYAKTPGFAEHRRHPNALIIIIGGHAALISAVMLARMDMPTKIIDPGTLIQWIPEPVDPPPQPPDPQPAKPHDPIKSTVDHYKPVVETPRPTPTSFDESLPSKPDFDRTIGSSLDAGPKIKPIPATPVRTAASSITPDRLLRPPYPADKQRLDEEGSLKLKLFIDERGRVTSVEPVGKVDRSFFESARRHLIANWRYKPATEDGHPVASSMVITLTFRLA